MLTTSKTCVTFQVGASAPVRELSSRSARQPSGERIVKAKECVYMCEILLSLQCLLVYVLVCYTHKYILYILPRSCVCVIITNARLRVAEPKQRNAIDVDKL
jgi:hypothetical protein